MRVVILGSGNVATVLGRLITKTNHTIVQIISRQLIHAKNLATELQCSFTDNYEEMDITADIYIIALVDDALTTLKNIPAIADKLIVHTAGSVSINALKGFSSTYGVLYPLQSLRKEMQYLPEIPWLVDGNTEETTTTIKDFASSFSSLVAEGKDEERIKLHVAAVLVSNFTNHLFSLTEQYCETEHLNFKILLPLIKETANRIEDYSPSNMQTGPAIRNDIFTIDRHLKLLTNHPKLKYLYMKITDSIMSR
ncbi:MAG: DUF2520 domain-containing protein [Sphingobacteriales bacterium]|nr:DUF2520 domain-containing protein [Sphingobacteriales bacterium]